MSQIKGGLYVAVRDGQYRGVLRRKGQLITVHNNYIKYHKSKTGQNYTSTWMTNDKNILKEAHIKELRVFGVAINPRWGLNRLKKELKKAREM